MKESIYVYPPSLCDAVNRFNNKHLQTPTVLLQAGSEGLHIRGSEGRYHARASVFTYDPLRPLESEVDSSLLAKACRFLFPLPYAAQIARIDNSTDALTIVNSVCDTRAVIRKRESEKTIEPPVYSFESTDFYRILKLVSFAAKNDPNHNRPELERIYFNSKAGELHITAVDGYRYSQYRVTDPTLTPGIAFAVEKEFLIRAERFITGTSRRSKETDIRLTDSHLVLSEKTQGFQAEIPLETVQPKMWENLDNALNFVGNGKAITFDSWKLKKRFKMFKQNHPVTLTAIQDNTVSLLEVSQRFATEHGKKSWGEPLWHDIKTAIPGDGRFEGKVSVNSKYLQQLLTASASKSNRQLIVEVADSRSPIVFIYPDKSFIHIVMPMHL